MFQFVQQEIKTFKFAKLHNKFLLLRVVVENCEFGYCSLVFVGSFANCSYWKFKSALCYSTDCSEVFFSDAWQCFEEVHNLYIQNLCL